MGTGYTLDMLFHLFLKTTRGRCYCSHFIDDETEAQLINVSKQQGQDDSKVDFFYYQTEGVEA